MSKISLKHSGGNVVSLNSPTSAPTSADVAFKLPNADVTSGQAIVTDASGNLSFAATGKILQVKSVSKTDTFSSNTAGAQDITGLTITMDAPASVNSKYFVIASLCGTASNSGFCFLLNGTTTGQLLTPSSTSSRIAGMGGELYHDRVDSNHYHTLTVLDDPDTTATQTYKSQIFIRSGQTGYVNRTSDEADSVGRIRSSSTLTVFEVAT